MVTSCSRALARPCPACAQHFGEGSARRLFLRFKHLRNTTRNEVSHHLGRKAEAGGSPQQRPAGAVPAVTAWTCRRAVDDCDQELPGERPGWCCPSQGHRSTGGESPPPAAHGSAPCPVLSQTESQPKTCRVLPFPSPCRLLQNQVALTARLEI